MAKLRAQLAWAMQIRAIDRLPAINDYVERLSRRPALMRAHAIDDALLAAGG